VSEMPDGPELDPRFIPAVDVIGRTGCKSFELRHHGGPDDHDVDGPLVWCAVATYPDGRFEVDASGDPVRAVLRLCERLIDGGVCVHCHRPSIFSEDITTAPFDALGCVTAWDPELKTFRRGCE
jgi:hypothetical protein